MYRIIISLIRYDISYRINDMIMWYMYVSRYSTLIFFIYLYTKTVKFARHCTISTQSRQTSLTPSLTPFWNGIALCPEHKNRHQTLALLMCLSFHPWIEHVLMVYLWHIKLETVNNRMIPYGISYPLQLGNRGHHITTFVPVIRYTAYRCAALLHSTSPALGMSS